MEFGIILVISPVQGICVYQQQSQILNYLLHDPYSDNKHIRFFDWIRILSPGSDSVYNIFV